MSLVSLSINFHTLTCWVCSASFAIPGTMARKREEDGKAFWCPNGCKLSFGKSKITLLQEELEAQRRRTEQAWSAHGRAADERDMARRSASAMKGQVTRIKNRVSKGVCPCCNRTFRNLARHMESKHPGYSGGEPQP